MKVTKMIAYCMIMFVTAVLFLALGIAVYRGNTKLIHDYHQTNIRESERQVYGKAFAKGLFAVCATLFISGVTALFGGAVTVSVIVLFAGLVISAMMLVRTQKKYNGGVF